MAEIKRIFLTGAPGSTWSRINKCLRGILDNADNTDIVPHRLHCSGNTEKTYNHMGAYFNPGNEFDEWILGFRNYTREEIEAKLDSVYNEEEDADVVARLGVPWMSKSGDRSIRIHISHYFAYHLDQIADMWPDAAIVLIWQEDHKCYVWWEHTGGHELEYDAYYYYKKDYESIWNQIRWQNSGIERFAWEKKLEPAIFNMQWVQNQFECVSGITDIPQDLNTPDGIPRLHIAPGGQLGLNNTTRVYCLNPWK
jgi:hypothetical protein